jgi:hypothetical protein
MVTAVPSSAQPSAARFSLSTAIVGPTFHPVDERRFIDLNRTGIAGGQFS